MKMQRIRREFRLSCLATLIGLMVLQAGTSMADEAVKIVIPRMVTAQAALNASLGGQATLITANGYMQGPAASIAQFAAQHGAMMSNASNTVLQQTGAVSLTAGTRATTTGVPRQPAVTGLATSPMTQSAPVVVGSIGGGGAGTLIISPPLSLSVNPALGGLVIPVGIGGQGLQPGTGLITNAGSLSVGGGTGIVINGSVGSPPSISGGSISLSTLGGLPSGSVITGAGYRPAGVVSVK